MSISLLASSSTHQHNHHLDGQARKRISLLLWQKVNFDAIKLLFSCFAIVFYFPPQSSTQQHSPGSGTASNWREVWSQMSSVISSLRWVLSLQDEIISDQGGEHAVLWGGREVSLRCHHLVGPMQANQHLHIIPTKKVIWDECCTVGMDYNRIDDHLILVSDTFQWSRILSDILGHSWRLGDTLWDSQMLDCLLARWSECSGIL